MSLSLLFAALAWDLPFARGQVNSNFAPSDSVEKSLETTYRDTTSAFRRARRLYATLSDLAKEHDKQDRNVAPYDLWSGSMIPTRLSILTGEQSCQRRLRRLHRKRDTLRRSALGAMHRWPRLLKRVRRVRSSRFLEKATPSRRLAWMVSHVPFAI